MTTDQIIVAVATGLASSAWGWYERRKAKREAERKAHAEAARKAELIRNIELIQRGSGDISELLDYVHSLDPLWRPKLK